MNIGIDRMICRACALSLAFLPVLLFAMPASAAELVHTRQTRFRIPYHSDPAELARLNAREVRLYVSGDRGGSWELSQSVAPNTGQFTFEASADGEYWFAVRTVDGAGRLYPPTDSNLTAGLKVMVDSQEPMLILSLGRSGDDVRLSWRASDAELALDSLVLEVRQGSDAEWKRVRAPAEARGELTWPAPQTGTVAVRGAIEDQAGNRAEASTDLVIEDSGYAPLPARPDLEGPIAGVEAKKPVQTAEKKPEGVPGKLVSREREVPPLSERKPVEAPIQVATVVQKETVQREQPAQEDEEDKLVQEEPADEPPQEIVENTPTPPEAVTPPPASTPPAEASSSPPRTASAETDGAQIVRVRQFQLGYQVDEVGPSGVGSVEFFITEDNGRTWYRYGTDADRESPFAITVPREGTYGFLVRVRSGVGLGGVDPRPGEQPAFQVVVDQTPPQVNIAPPTQRAGSISPVVQLRWQTSDPHPQANGSVDIAYGTTPEGPWEPIASGIDDTGQYDWQTENIPGGRLYLRVTARDAAGNIGQGVTAEPVVVDFVRPTARIIEVAVP